VTESSTRNARSSTTAEGSQPKNRATSATVPPLGR
jgi:hypothetical protein